MNIQYLQEVIIPQREKEIKEGRNAHTKQPIYVVMSVQENIVLNHVDIDDCNYCGKQSKMGYYDLFLDSENREFSESDEGMKNAIPCTQYFTDKIVAFFLTRKAAEEYLEYQKHNLYESFIYVFYSGYKNREMDMLFKNGEEIETNV